MRQSVDQVVMTTHAANDLLARKMAERAQRRRRVDASEIYMARRSPPTRCSPTPAIRSKAELANFGYKLAIFRSITGLAAAAIATALRISKSTGASVSPDLKLFAFARFNSLIGFDEVWKFERRWARPEADSQPSKAG
jgi:hypothetical protein